MRVVYDRAPSTFQRQNIKEIHAFFSTEPFIHLNDTPLNLKSTFTTHMVGKSKIEYKIARPAVLVTSTSFTEDEDLGVLFDALKMYDGVLNRDTPGLVVFITGRGPMKVYYEGVLSRIVFKRVRVEMIWLAIEDYPTLLGLNYLFFYFLW